MAEGLLAHLCGEGFEPASAGSEPSEVNSYAIRVMASRGIDISSHASKSVETMLSEQFDYVITLCGDAARACPAFPGNSKRLHWDIKDPAPFDGSDEETLRVFENTRNIIEAFVRLFIENNRD